MLRKQMGDAVYVESIWEDVITRSETNSQVPLEIPSFREVAKQW